MTCHMMAKLAPTALSLHTDVNSSPLNEALLLLNQ